MSKVCNEKAGEAGSFLYGMAGEMVARHRVRRGPSAGSRGVCVKKNRGRWHGVGKAVYAADVLVH